jgi:tripartite-type tricarboxylate transporter receptor subunit TctC
MTTTFTSRRATIALLAISMSLPGAMALAQSDKPLRLIVPNAPGSSVDALARIVSVPLSKSLGHSIVVENLPGAGGVPATGQLVRAPKDGLTLAMVSNNHVVNPSLYKSMPFDSIKDITTVAVVAGSPFVLVAHPSLGVSNLKELVALAKAKPDQITIGSSGNGTILHLVAEELQHEAGISLRHIPYKGTGQMTTDLLGGQIQLAFVGVTGAVQHVKAGKLRAIGVSTLTPSAVLPEVAPFSQQGLPNFNMQGWIALIGPAGMAPAVVSKLSSEVIAMLGTKEMKDALAAQGFTPIGSTPAAAATTFQTDMAKYAKLVKQSGMTID